MAADLAILVSSYQRSHHLLRVLTSIACQQGVDWPRLEVVVTDDGSRDETIELIQEFARTAPFPLAFTTHPHETFQLARCRNEGVRASTAEYLLFLDGDCLLPPDHLWQHLRRRRRRTAMAGYCVLLTPQQTEQITTDAIRRADYLSWADKSELRKLARLDRKSRFYELLRHPTKPKLFGGNIGIWRDDYERVNGYDEEYEGWGCEDDDLRLRLRRSGTRIRSILRWTRTYHLWHPRGETTPSSWKAGRNVRRLTEGIRPTRCARGLYPLGHNRERAA